LRAIGFALTLWFGFAAAATDAAACPYCVGGASATGDGYQAATLLMLLIPLGLIGGFALWVRRFLRSREDGEGTDAPIHGHAPPRTGRRDG
jgi:hypothetical protein